MIDDHPFLFGFAAVTGLIATVSFLIAIWSHSSEWGWTGVVFAALSMLVMVGAVSD